MVLALAVLLDLIIREVPVIVFAIFFSIFLPLCFYFDIG
jgi:hypothetical protein